MMASRNGGACMKGTTMIAKGWTARVLAAGAFAGSMVCGLAFGQPPAAPEEAPPTPRAFLALERASLREFLVDGKDQVLRRALGMLPDRVNDLPRELAMDAETAALVKSMLLTLAKPCKVAITYTPNYQKGGAMGYGFVMSVPMPDAAEAETLHGRVMRAIGAEAADLSPSKRFPGMMEANLPVAPLRFGPRKGAGGTSYDIIWGAVGDADVAFAEIPKPTHPMASTVVNGVVDFSQLTTLVGLGKTAASGARGPQAQAAQQVAKKLASYGLYGSDAVVAHFQMGYTKDASVTHVEVRNAEKPLAAMGIESGTVTEADLRAIPADAVMASASAWSTKAYTDLLADLVRAEPQAKEALAQFKAATDVDLVEDVMNSLGGVAIAYASDTTGGGSIGSSVLLLSFADRDRFVTAHGKLVAALMKAIASSPDGEQVRKYVRMDTATEDGTTLYALRTPGIPIPFEVTYAMTPRYLVLGLTPQSVLAAVRQANGKGDRGIVSRAEVASQLPKGKGLISVSFADTPRLMGAGYPLVCLAGVGIANGVRSPADASRDPGMVVPVYNELRAGVRPTVAVTYHEGELVVLHSTSDRSMLVGASGALGGLLRAWPIAAAVGIGVGATVFKERMGAAGPWEDRAMALAYDAALGPNAWISPASWAVEGATLAPGGTAGARGWLERATRE